MDILERLVSSMNKEDVRHFKLYTARIHVQQDRKDLQLFDMVRRSGEDFSDDEAFRLLYKGSDKNPFYRLKNRLVTDLNKSILLQSFSKDEEVYLHNLLALCRYYYNQNQFELSLHFLKKAEKYAQKLENYELLDIIYGEFIRLSHEILSINPETFIAKRSANRGQLRQLREIDDLLAIISYRLKISQTLSGKNESIISMLESLIEKHKGSLDLQKSTKLRIKLYRSVSQILLQRQDFQALTDYLLRTHDEFTAMAFSPKPPMIINCRCSPTS
ncbi:MAG: hypothetical protein WD077_02695 [Bacteroidia bacterium]